MTDVRRGGFVGNVVFRACQRYGDREALVVGEQRLTYRRLLDRVRRMMAVFDRLGMGDGSSLAIVAYNSLDVVIVYMAALASGIRLTPLAPAMSVEDQAWILNDAEIDTLIVDSRTGRQLERLRAEAAGLSRILALGDVAGAQDLSALTDAEAPSDAPLRRPNGDVSVIYYTGGTTGRPKGVVLTHDSVMAAVMMETAEWEWPEDLRVLVSTPVSHAAGGFLWPTLLKGGAMHVLPSFVAEDFAAYVRREAITVTFLVPTMIYKLMESGIDQNDLRSLRTIVYGAAPIDPGRLAEAIRQFGPIFMQLYGQTEAPSCISYLGKSQHRLDDPESLTSCGVPLGNIDVAILDAEGRPVAPHEAGEVCVRGALVMKEYWRRPEETAEAFAGGWLHTGDIGRFDHAGRLHITDRKKDMIITGGFNVYPSEIEAVLRRHPLVREAAVFGVPDSYWGEAVTAAIVAAADVQPAEEELREAVRTSKGAIHCPKRFVFVDALPLTAIGKVDKKALRAAFAG